MRICLVTEYFYPEDAGGTPTVLSQLMRCLKDKYSDLQIDVITSSNLYRRAETELAKYEDWDGVHIYRISSPRSNRPSTALRLLAGCVFSTKVLARMACGARYDVVVAGTNPPSAPVAASWLHRWRRIPYCYLVHDLYPDIAIAVGAIRSGGRIAQVAHRWQRRWLHDATSIVVLGRCMRAHLASHYSVPPGKVEVITSWSDPLAISPVSKETSFRGKHDLGSFLVVYAGGIGRSQGLDVLLDAATHLRQSHPHIVFVLVGGGDAWDDLATRIRVEQITNVKLIEAVPPDAYPEVLASADVAIVALDPRMEGLAVPSKSYNILASGRPLIAVIGAACEVALMVSEHECGRCVRSGDGEELARCVAELSADPALCDVMGRNARRALLEHYTLDHIATQFRSVLERTALQRPL